MSFYLTISSFNMEILMLKKFRAFNLSVEFYHSCQKLRINRHLYDQLIRASSSIALNLAEGYGKATPKDQKRFYQISLGSIRECEAILTLERIKDTKILDLLDHLGASVFKLCRKN